MDFKCNTLLNVISIQDDLIERQSKQLLRLKDLISSICDRCIDLASRQHNADDRMSEISRKKLQAKIATLRKSATVTFNDNVINSSNTIISNRANYISVETLEAEACIMVGLVLILTYCY